MGGIGGQAVTLALSRQAFLPLLCPSPLLRTPLPGADSDFSSLFDLTWRAAVSGSSFDVMTGFGTRGQDANVIRRYPATYSKGQHPFPERGIG